MVKETSLLDQVQGFKGSRFNLGPYKGIYVQNVQKNYCDLRKAASKKGLRGI
jgi:hypothetical protein